jgi:hypothetical protein
MTALAHQSYEPVDYSLEKLDEQPWVIASI